MNPENTTEPTRELPAEQTQNPVTWPDDLSVPAEAKEAFENLIKTCKLPSQTAQQLVELEVSFARKNAQETEKLHQQQQAAWAEETKQFFGPAWEKEVDIAVRAADTFGGAELRSLLAETGLGNHPVIVRTFNGIGKRISEDCTPVGKNTAGTDKTFAEALYGKEN